MQQSIIKRWRKLRAKNVKKQVLNDKITEYQVFLQSQSQHSSDFCFDCCLDEETIIQWETYKYQQYEKYAYERLYGELGEYHRNKDYEKARKIRDMLTCVGYDGFRSPKLVYREIFGEMWDYNCKKETEPRIHNCPFLKSNDQFENLNPLSRDCFRSCHQLLPSLLALGTNLTFQTKNNEGDNSRLRQDAQTRTTKNEVPELFESSSFYSKENQTQDIISSFIEDRENGGLMNSFSEKEGNGGLLNSVSEEPRKIQFVFQTKNGRNICFEESDLKSLREMIDKLSSMSVKSRFDHNRPNIEQMVPFDDKGTVVETSTQFNEKSADNEFVQTIKLNQFEIPVTLETGDSSSIFSKKIKNAETNDTVGASMQSTIKSTIFRKLKKCKKMADYLNNRQLEPQWSIEVNKQWYPIELQDASDNLYLKDIFKEQE